MIDITLSYKHRIRNLSPDGLRPRTSLSVTEAPHNTEFYTWMGKKHFCFFQTAETGNRTPNPSVKGSGANHYPRAPARAGLKKQNITTHNASSSKQSNERKKEKTNERTNERTQKKHKENRQKTNKQQTN